MYFLVDQPQTGHRGEVQPASASFPLDICIRVKAKVGHLIQATSALCPFTLQSPESPGALGATQPEPSLDQVLQERDEALAK